MSKYQKINLIYLKTCLNFLFILFVNYAFSQSLVLHGKVTDTLQTPLGYANILDIPENDNEEVAFAID